ncbi:MAG: hypothetical protein ACOVO9_04545 [Bacteroidia bacterium]
MKLQFIFDNNGNTTGVFIPIDDWQALKAKYAGLENEDIKYQSELETWQKQIIDDRLNDYYKNSIDTKDFDDTLDDIEKNL